MVAEATEAVSEAGKVLSEPGGHTSASSRPHSSDSFSELDAAAALVQELAAATAKPKLPAARAASSRLHKLMSEVRQASAVTTCSVDWSAVSAASLSSSDDGGDA